MFRKPLFWSLLIAAALASGVLALRLFPQAFPIVQIDLTMDREAALSAARDLAAREGLGPGDYREAASFATDSQVQTFVELEGGGKDAYAQMLRDGLYAAYTWRVRHFKEGEKRETLTRFRPDGRPYGFLEQIEETAPGPELSAEAARAAAESKAVQTWLVDLTPFALVEQSRERRATGRVDHTFTYERSSPTLNEGRYRLRLGVTGDRLTEVTHFVRIPQAFSRRYEEMRSANEAIGAAGSIGMVVVYVIGGIGVGLFWLLRERWVIARPAILWGVAVAALQLLVGVNEWPLLWMSYDTAVPRATFISQQLAVLLASFAGFAAFFSFSFMAAESLGRRAFGQHPQLWRVWSREAAASKTVLGQTAGGYLLVALFFAYDVLLYLYATRWFDWWTPSEALIHPDILATYAPWLSAIANSFQAGFWEEALFRAVPIAGAALIGDRFGQRRLFIVLAFVVQILIFGAGHAPYPTQPSYARPVELILPSIGFGLIYLQFGLLPGIILHYAFDVIWFALPLFVSDTSGIWLDRTLVIALTLVPLLVVVFARLRVGQWLELSPELRNSSSRPSAVAERPVAEISAPVASPIGSGLVRTWLAVGVLALAVWVLAEQFRAPVPPVVVSRNDAARIAREALVSRGVTLGPEWRVMPIVESGRGEAHAFAWQKAGRDRFLALLGRYLSTPRWRVRVATFEGDIAARAEEWTVLVNHRGEVERIGHQLPESRPGASLTESDARAIALRGIEQVLQLPASSLREISAQPAKLSARTDWTFTFQDVTVEPIPVGGGAGSPSPDAGSVDAQGEARVEVGVAGDEVARVRPFLRVPEAWQRDRRAENTLAQIVGILAILIAAGALVTSAIAGIIAWSRRRSFARAFAIALFGVFVLLSLVMAINRWPTMMASLVTARPFELQVAMLAGLGLIGVLAPAAMVALAAGTLPHRMPRRRTTTTRQAWMLGVSLGIVAAAAIALARASSQPAWPDVSPLATYLPLLASALERIPGLLLRTVTVLVLLTAVDHFTRGWTIRRVVFGAALVVAGALLGAPGDMLSIWQWLVGAAVAGLALFSAYVFLLRFDLSLTPIAMATAILLEQIREAALDGFSGAFAGSVVGIIVTAAVAWWMFSLLRRARDGTVVSLK